MASTFRVIIGKILSCKNNLRVAPLLEKKTPYSDFIILPKIASDFFLA